MEGAGGAFPALHFPYFSDAVKYTDGQKTWRYLYVNEMALQDLILHSNTPGTSPSEFMHWGSDTSRWVSASGGGSAYAAAGLSTGNLLYQEDYDGNVLAADLPTVAQQGRINGGVVDGISYAQVRMAYEPGKAYSYSCSLAATSGVFPYATVELTPGEFSNAAPKLSNGNATLRLAWPNATAAQLQANPGAYAPTIQFSASVSFSDHMGAASHLNGTHSFSYAPVWQGADGPGVEVDSRALDQQRNAQVAIPLPEHTAGQRHVLWAFKRWAADDGKPDPTNVQYGMALWTCQR